MKRILLLVCIIFSFTCSNAGTVTIYRAGLPLSPAYTTLSAAALVIADGDSVVLSPDVFRGSDGNCELNKNIILCGTRSATDSSVLDSAYVTVTDAASVLIRDIVIRNTDGGAIRGGPDTRIIVAGYSRLYKNGNLYADGSAIYSAGTVEIKGNTVIDSNSAWQGGAVSALVLYVSGNAIIAGNTSFRYGGAVYCDSICTFSGNARFSRNTCLMDGGCVYGKWNCTISDSVIVEYSNAGNNGGAIFISDGNCILSGSVRIRGNSTTEYGGAVFCYGECHITDDVVLDSNSVRDHGAAISTLGDCTISGRVRMTGNKVWGLSGTYSTGGGAVWCGGDCSISGNTYIDGNIGYYAGAVYTKGKCTLSGNVIIRNNNAVLSGGAIYSEQECVVSDSVQIDSNTARANGGGIITEAGCSLSGDVIISHNNASAGGGIYVYKSVAELKDRVRIINNVAPGAGGSGGGICIYVGTMYMNDQVEISNNEAAYGGAVFNGVGRVYVNGGQMTGNITYSGRHGAAVYNSSPCTARISNARIYNPAGDGSRQNEIYNEGLGYRVVFDTDSTWWGSSDTTGLIYNWYDVVSTIHSWVIADWVANDGLPVGASTAFPLAARFTLNTGMPFKPRLFPRLRGYFTATDGGFAPADTTMDTTNVINSFYTAGSGLINITAYADADTFHLVSTLNVKESFARNVYQVYPNPSDGNVTINSMAIPGDSVNAIVYDLTGRIRYSSSLPVYNGKASLSMQLPAGDYLLELKNAELAGKFAVMLQIR